MSGRVGNYKKFIDNPKKYEISIDKKVARVCRDGRLFCISEGYTEISLKTKSGIIKQYSLLVGKGRCSDRILKHNLTFSKESAIKKYVGDELYDLLSSKIKVDITTRKKVNQIHYVSKINDGTVYACCGYIDGKLNIILSGKNLMAYLHEYGHAFDILYEEKFGHGCATLPLSIECFRNENQAYGYYSENTTEFFADCFALYFCDGLRMRRLMPLSYGMIDFYVNKYVTQ